MRPSSRIAASIELLELIDGSFQKPADLIANQFFRHRRYIGSKDRKEISSIVWNVLRNWRKLNWYFNGGQGHATQRDIVALYLLQFQRYAFKELVELFEQTPYGPGKLEKKEIDSLKVALLQHQERQKTIASNVIHEVPLWFYKACQNIWGSKVDIELDALHRQAPFDLRVNLLKEKREPLARWLKNHEDLPVEETPFSPWGLRLPHRYQVMGLQSFQDGLFEIQDEGSQIVAAASGVKPRDRVMDYCAGAGGKTLALAMMMQNKGHIMACDVSKIRLQGAVKRARRAGISNTQFSLFQTHKKNINRKKGSFDCVLVDAPCSGTGTLRRNPDIAVRLDEDTIKELVEKQRIILQKAASFVKVGGRLLYATCSILPEENQEQIAQFLQGNQSFQLVANRSEWLPHFLQKQEMIHLTPAQHDTDGFFVATMERIS